MGAKMDACAECSRSCSSLHKTKLDPYPIVSSFFKVMFGNQFSELMIVPPKFAKYVMPLEAKSIYLEDSTGQKWKVNLSNVNGSLAFQEGWHEFSVDHGIELGDFVAFHYFKGSHFAVQIYGRNGCEKPMIFSRKDYQNKRAELAEDSDSVLRTDACDLSYKEYPARERFDTCMDSGPPDVDVIQRKVDTHNVEKLPETGENIPRPVNFSKRPKVIPTIDLLVESFFLTDKTASFAREDNRCALFDLSVFEMPRKEADTSVIRENTCSKVSNLLQAQSKVSSPDALKCQMAELTFEISNEADRSRKELVASSKNNISRVDMPLNSSIPLKSITVPNMSEISAVAPSSQPPCERKRMVKRMKIVKRKSIVRQERISSELAICGLNANSANLFTAKGHQAANENVCIHSASMDENKGQRDKIEKTEALEFCESSSALDFKITCLVQPDSEYFLVLPKPLPVKVHRQGKNLEQNLVFLRDPVGRLWPVIYHQRNGFEVLACGWKEFRKSNEILPGDKCTFAVENINEGIIQVQIVSQLPDKISVR